MKSRVNRVYLVGRGDSLFVMFGVRALFEKLLGISCETMQALDFVHCNNHLPDPETLVIALSSSGATTRTVEAILLAKALGARTLSLTNTLDSPLNSGSDHSLHVHAERKGWPTQPSTSALALLAQFVIRIAGMEARKEIFLFAYGGLSFASASFGAARVKECTPSHAIAIQLKEFHHYNSRKAGAPLWLIAPSGPSIARARDTAEGGTRWGGNVYSITSVGEISLTGSSDDSVFVPPMPEELTPLVCSVPVPSRSPTMSPRRRSVWPNLKGRAVEIAAPCLPRQLYYG